ncbi:hypothetical protein AXW85_33360 [Pseudomonas aeruginosa]|nr:hypothetical protein AXW85_33360 [Pseudomonas aeruginosa]
MIEPERIKLDQERAISWMQIANAVDGFRLQQTKQLQHALMVFERDLLAEVNQKRLIARGSELRLTRP